MVTCGLSKMDLAHVSDEHSKWYQQSIQNPELFWGDLARKRLRWFKDFDTVMRCNLKEGDIEWFLGGVINVSGELSLLLSL